MSYTTNPYSNNLTTPLTDVERVHYDKLKKRLRDGFVFSQGQYIQFNWYRLRDESQKLLNERNSVDEGEKSFVCCDKCTAPMICGNNRLCSIDFFTRNK